MPFNKEQYLSRIGISQPEASAEGLARLQSAQLRAIAFENIDPLLGVTPSLDTASVVRKLIFERRGGYCFELNSLFGQALGALGFHYTPVLARVRMGQPEGGPRTHLCFLVEAEAGAWLADAGFGGPGFSVPLQLEIGLEQAVDGETFRIRQDSLFDERVVEKHTADGWFALYGFDRASVRFCDLEAGNVVCSNWSQSPFPFHLMMNRCTPGGRISIFDTNFTEMQSGLSETRIIETPAELGRIICDGFGIGIEPATLEAIAARLNFERDDELA
jgi:N-hydroxyarylamine O-acetyltransferase